MLFSTRLSSRTRRFFEKPRERPPSDRVTESCINDRKKTGGCEHRPSPFRPPIVSPATYIFNFTVLISTAWQKCERYYIRFLAGVAQERGRREISRYNRVPARRGPAARESMEHTLARRRSAACPPINRKSIRAPVNFRNARHRFRRVGYAGASLSRRRRYRVTSSARSAADTVGRAAIRSGHAALDQVYTRSACQKFSARQRAPKSLARARETAPVLTATWNLAGCRKERFRVQGWQSTVYETITSSSKIPDIFNILHILRTQNIFRPFIHTRTRREFSFSLLSEVVARLPYSPRSEIQGSM